ncbi:hypothetical protein JYU34_002884 [Plutella xylostella]|uniref:Uncharacterized protein n=1 Tax=Plutella xylostella TaxID=51655 RepID=A0ABQ7R3D1_PLUXY|nr:hypothetical protein JYU34_002884 [Plutella xylostella]
MACGMRAEINGFSRRARAQPYAPPPRAHPRRPCQGDTNDGPAPLLRQIRNATIVNSLP